jgi:hypothetical protein
MPHKKELLNFIDKLKLKSQFNGKTTKKKNQLDHIWANVLGNECKSNVSEAYRLDFQTNLYYIQSIKHTSSV